MNRPLLFRLGLALSLVFLVLSGCAVTNGSSSSSSGGDPTVISRAEIEDVGEISNAYNLVRRLKPHWLQKRGRNSLRNPGEILVYVEDSQQGGPQTLQQIDVIDVESIEFLRPSEATMRYGSGHDNGAILVNLKEG